MLTHLPPSMLVAYGFLLAAIVGLWLPWRFFWVIALVVSIVFGYFSGVLVGPAAIWIALLLGLCLIYRHWKSLGDSEGKRARLVLSAIAIAIVAVLLSIHALPGFHNALLVKNLVIAPGSAPYTRYLNFDKTIAGILLLGVVYPDLMRTTAQWREAFRKAVGLILINIAVVMLLAFTLGFVRFDPKWTSFFWPWAITNLFFTCMAEETFFRGFVQRELNSMLSGLSYHRAISVAVSASLFGLAHIAGGWSYVSLAAVAGLGYAMVYDRTGRVEMAMLAHFSLNAAHFLLLTYPRAA